MSIEDLIPFKSGYDPRRHKKQKGEISFRQALQRMLAESPTKLGLPEVMQGLRITNIADAMVAQMILFFYAKDTKRETKLRILKQFSDAIDGIKIDVTAISEENDELSNKIKKLPLDKLLAIEKLINGDDNKNNDINSEQKLPIEEIILTPFNYNLDTGKEYADVDADTNADAIDNKSGSSSSNDGSVDICADNDSGNDSIDCNYEKEKPEENNISEIKVDKM